MRIVMHVAIVLLLATPAVVQAQGHQAKEEKTKEEIQKLFSDLNDAITKRDRPRLEQLYADEERTRHERASLVGSVGEPLKRNVRSLSSSEDTKQSNLAQASFITVLRIG